MKTLFFSIFLSIIFLNAASTTSKIHNSKKDLSVTKNAKKKANRQLGKIAKDIQKAEKEIVYLDKKLESLTRNQTKNEIAFKVLKIDLKNSTKDFEKTSQSLDKKHHQFLALLSKQFSIVFAMEQAHAPTKESVLSQEVYLAYKKYNFKVLANLKQEIKVLKKRKENKRYLQKQTKHKIKEIIKKRKLYAKQKKAKEKLLKNLASDEEKYNIKLVKIVDKQNSLRATLAHLNILQKQEVLDAKKLAMARKKAIRLEKERKRRMRKAKSLALAKARKAKEALRRAKTKEAKKKARLAAKEAEKERKAVYKESEKVRNINSSYHKSKVYAYRGGKTISPISGARLIKKFGTYIDPIYKIKIFNESITLKAPNANSKVKNVLNGKVVFAGKSSMLGKVVVVAHSGKIHTVYAGLSKIAPNIKSGRMIKKGYILGKVHSKLMFQATKNSKHINPLKLIRI